MEALLLYMQCEEGLILRQMDVGTGFDSLSEGRGLYDGGFSTSVEYLWIAKPK